jgi:pSer/pThr/pTyr-binding forkhead associated (FHA) protein
VVLEDPNVSRRHAEIRPLGTAFVVTDLGSTNGTLVNGGAVKQQVLQPGDVITLGSSSLRYESS